MVGATTTEGASEVVDTEVDVVSTTIALLDVADAGAGDGFGVVDRTTEEVELDATGAAT